MINILCNVLIYWHGSEIHFHGHCLPQKVDNWQFLPACDKKVAISDSPSINNFHKLKYFLHIGTFIKCNPEIQTSRISTLDINHDLLVFEAHLCIFPIVP